jgi:phage tail P2-like protein
VTAASRFYARLEPIAFDDDGTLQDLATALMSPVEIAEVSRDSDDGLLVAWEALWDPDACPAELLDWLAVANGVILPPSALTADEKRYRIKQAAGRYRGTPRALVEEIQLVLTGDKTVLLGYQNGDEWHYAVGTIAAETPDENAVDAAIARQNPAFMIPERILTSDWTWLVLAPTLIAVSVDGVYTISTPTYPTWTSVTSAFTDWTDLVAGP